MSASSAQRRYDELRGRNLALDITRGKPAAAQLDLADEMLTCVGPGEAFGEDGTDYRNYGVPAGIPEARRFFAEYIGCEPARVIVGGNASLTLMYDALDGAWNFGVPGGDGPWRDQGAKVICPVPGYDRHFAICERLGLEMITVEMREDGPDIDAVEELVASDASIKAIWCVPKYSNPTGIVYSDEVAQRLAAMKTAAPDFRILWDNAYAVHHFGDGPAEVANILDLCDAAGTADRPYVFVSTSKMTHAGAGVAAFAGSDANVKDMLEKLGFKTIGPDKINQLRHVKFFKDFNGVLAHMQRHAEIVGPKFEAVEAALEKNLGGKGVAEWTAPKGGYFVSVDVPDGCASEAVRLAADAGVKITPAGATFPYGKDPRDRNIRIAPTMPTVEEVEKAMEVFCACVELAVERKQKGAA